MGGKGTELFIEWARILQGIFVFEDGRRANGKTTVHEDAGLNLLRVDSREGWKATGVSPGLKGDREGNRGETVGMGEWKYEETRMGGTYSKRNFMRRTSSVSYTSSKLWSKGPGATAVV
jgi:hypothetical protein